MILAAVVLYPALADGSAGAQWLQWGGPNRNFTVETSGLPDAWPEGGPKKLWHRTLGTGYSSIVVDDGMLFTMYRKSKEANYEFTVALDAATGKTIWQKRNLAAVPKSTKDYGKEFSGPNATPLIVGDRLYTLGRNAALHCFQKADGTVLWKHKLQKNFGAQIETCGYSCSPIAYGNTIIVPLGRAENDKREGKSLVAFDQVSGEVVWRRHTFRICHSSPILINFGGKDQIVLGTTDALIGVDPINGDLLWKYTSSPQDFERILATPVWNGEDTLLFSSAEIGSAVKLTAGDKGTTVEQLWSSNKTRLGQGTPVLIGDMVVGSKHGNPTDSVYMAVDIRTGKRLWLKRVFPMSVAVGGGGKLVVLDHSGQLALATATREGLTIHSQCRITEKWSFTCPTLIGTTLYVRDEKHIMALDLADPQSPGGA
jgi:outer membrane protein assembly factor BamB